MKTSIAVSLRDFSISLILVLAEKEVVVIDKPRTILYAALEFAYDSVRKDVEQDLRSEIHISLYEIRRDSFDADEVVDYLLGARLITSDSSGQVFRVAGNSSFTKAYFELAPAKRAIYEKAAQVFLDFTG